MMTCKATEREVWARKWKSHLEQVSIKSSEPEISMKFSEGNLLKHSHEILEVSAENRLILFHLGLLLGQGDCDYTMFSWVVLTTVVCRVTFKCSHLTVHKETHYTENSNINSYSV